MSITPAGTSQVTQDIYLSSPSLSPCQGTGCCQESFWLSVARLGLGIWVPKDHVFSCRALVTEFASSHSLPIFKFGAFKEAVQAFVCAVFLNLGLWPESINPINVQEWEGWKCLICASCWHHLILSFWNEPTYD